MISPTLQRLHNQYALAISLVVSLSFGVSYANEGSNHHTYLLTGLRRLDPQFLQNDWLLNETYSYHPLFSWFVLLAGRLGSVAWGLAGTNTLLTTLAIFLLYRLLMTLSKETAFPSFLLLGFFLIVDGTTSVAMTSIFTTQLLPATFAATAMIAAHVFFVRGCWVISGVALGISGAFHANYLLAGLISFGTAHLILGSDRLVNRGAKQFGPSLIALGLTLPIFLEVSASANAGAAQYIIQFVRAPHHYLPRTFLVDFLPFAAWHVLGLGLLPRLGAPVQMRTRFVSMFAALFLVLGLTMLLTTVVYVPAVSHLFLWRLAPFSVLFAQIIACVGIVSLLHSPPLPEAGSWRSPSVPLAASGSLLLAASYLFLAPVNHLRLIAATFWLLVPVLLVFGHRLRSRLSLEFQGTRAAIALGLSFFCVAGVLQAPRTLGDSNLLRSDLSYQELSLYRWVRSTDENSRFLTPPDLASFRVFGRRAIVVDWKSPPMLPDEVVEWYRRINLVAGSDRVGSRDDAVEGYAAMTDERLQALVREFHVDYALLRKPAVTSNRWPVAYENQAFVVLRMAGR